MRIIKITSITLLLLVIAVALAWSVLYYLVWPKPEILGLVPSTPLAYMAASKLGEILPAVEKSEFIDQAARSPLWKDFKASGLWQQAKLQKYAWERQMGASIDSEGIIQLIEKDALLAFYGGQRSWSFLLISQVGLVTRINITSRSTKRMLASRYIFTTEKYRGIELMTVAAPGGKFSYGFIGRAGILSTDKSLLKEAVDLHMSGRRLRGKTRNRKRSAQGLAATPGFRRLVGDLPVSDISFYVNVANIRETAGLSRTLSSRADAEISSQLHQLMSVAHRIDAWAGVGSSQYGNLRFDHSFLYEDNTASIRRPLNSIDSVDHGRVKEEKTSVDKEDTSRIQVGNLANDELAVPTNCLLFMTYEILRPGFLFEVLEAAVGTDLDVAIGKLLPVLHNGAAVAVLEPNIKELQLLPVVMIILKVKNMAIAEEVLENLSGSTRIGRRQLEFVEIRHENIPINYTRLPIGMGMSIDAGYTLVGDNLLVIATDTSALEAAIDVALGKRQSLMDNEQYINVLAPILETSKGRMLLNVRSTAIMAKQAARLYAWRAKVAGEREAERIATILYQNAFILETWHYLGATFASEGDKATVKLIMSSE